MKLLGQLTQVNALTSGQRSVMFDLMDRHYLNMSRSAFETDLAEKTWVILVSEPLRNSICGFSTQTLLHIPSEGRTIRALFSGDTIIAKEHWGDRALSHIWGQLALQLISQFGDDNVHWFLTSKGYKTYRFLPLFFHDFFPRFDLPTPDWATRMIDTIAQHKYPARYDSRSGLIHPGPLSDRLRPGVADLTPLRMSDPHIRFFSQQNPRHAEGDELCCVAPLSLRNFTPAAYRVIGPIDAPVEK